MRLFITKVLNLLSGYLFSVRQRYLRGERGGRSRGELGFGFSWMDFEEWAARVRRVLG